MGTCTSKPPKPNPYASREHSPDDQTHPSQAPKSPPTPLHDKPTSTVTTPRSPFFPFYSPSPAHFLKKSPASAAAAASANSTPRRFFKRPFPPPSPAKHIKAVLARRHGKKAAKAIPEEEEGEEGGRVELDKRFGFSKELTSRLEVGDEVGRGHFGYTCSARFRKGEFKGQQVAVKVIPKAKVGPKFILFYFYVVECEFVLYPC